MIENIFAIEVKRYTYFGKEKVLTARIKHPLDFRVSIWLRIEV